ncbi:hypothetical protein [Pseudomonas sp. S2_F03]
MTRTISTSGHPATVCFGLASFSGALVNLLHSWDWLPLLERSLLREVLIIALSLGGFAISVTGIVLGWRRLLRSRNRHRKSPTVTLNPAVPHKEKR